MIPLYKETIIQQKKFRYHLFLMKLKYSFSLYYHTFLY